MKIKINYLFLIFLFIWAATGLLKEVILVFGSVVFHELAHSLVSRGYGVPVKEIELYPFGGVARVEGLWEVDPAAERKIAWAGPLANIFLAGAAIVMLVNDLFWGPWDAEAANYFIQLNMAMAVFNLVPALPLDGGRILRARLAGIYNYRRATEIAVLMGKILAVFSFATGVIFWCYGHFSLAVFVLAVFIYLAASREQNLAVYVFLNALTGKEAELKKKGGLRGEQIIARRDTSLLDIFRLFSPQRYHLIRIIDEKTGRFEAELPEKHLVEAAVSKGVEIPLKKIL